MWVGESGSVMWRRLQKILCRVSVDLSRWPELRLDWSNPLSISTARTGPCPKGQLVISATDTNYTRRIWQVYRWTKVTSVIEVLSPKIYTMMEHSQGTRRGNDLVRYGNETEWELLAASCRWVLCAWCVVERVERRCVKKAKGQPSPFSVDLVNGARVIQMWV